MLHVVESLKTHEMMLRYLYSSVGWMTKVASHKFLVSVIRAPDVFDDSSKTLRELWSSVPVDPTNYMEQKCVAIIAQRNIVVGVIVQV